MSNILSQTNYNCHFKKSNRFGNKVNLKMKEYVIRFL